MEVRRRRLDEVDRLKMLLPVRRRARGHLSTWLHVVCLVLCCKCRPRIQQQASTSCSLQVVSGNSSLFARHIRPLPRLGLSELQDVRH
ncbi:hypothetical protein Ae201684P_013262 [Aphanomyces euteiches]|uniref:Uncharacterized protein n=1 Tax=Aphanomyces euteiches TaxID=100861 RepID=A0A6G0WRW2_9STRA|nr:hypothetical protein Ae201684_012198 [Aphanomyces euteiches]KAH9096596.1 hypothetical protein Ae201684P_013262 [Aphanomyces euteiches]